MRSESPLKKQAATEEMHLQPPDETTVKQMEVPPLSLLHAHIHKPHYAHAQICRSMSALSNHRLDAAACAMEWRKAYETTDTEAVRCMSAANGLFCRRA